MQGKADFCWGRQVSNGEGRFLLGKAGQSEIVAIRGDVILSEIKKLEPNSEQEDVVIVERDKSEIVGIHEDVVVPVKTGDIEMEKYKENKEVLMVYRATKPGQDMFISVKVGDMNLSFLVDTGASCTIVSEETFRELKRLPEAGKVCAERRKLQTADGAHLNVLGKLKLSIQLGSVVVQHDVIGANITDFISLISYSSINAILAWEMVNC